MRTRIIKLKVGNEKIVIDATQYGKAHWGHEIQEIVCEQNVEAKIEQEAKFKDEGYD